MGRTKQSGCRNQCINHIPPLLHDIVTRLGAHSLPGLQLPSVHRTRQCPIVYPPQKQAATTLCEMTSSFLFLSTGYNDRLRKFFRLHFRKFLDHLRGGFTGTCHGEALRSWNPHFLWDPCSALQVPSTGPTGENPLHDNGRKYQIRCTTRKQE